MRARSVSSARAFSTASRERSASGSSTPALRASSRATSMKLFPSTLPTKVKTSPDSPHPKQWKNCFWAFTLNEGLFSLWNGHKPLWLVPARLSDTYSPMTCTMSVRSRISAILSSGISPKSSYSK